MLVGMKLTDFTSEIESAASLAHRMGINPTLISQWKFGIRPIPLPRCVEIERLTGGQVMRWDLRPEDWWLIWPELAAHPDAPPIPTDVSSTSNVELPHPQG